MPGEDSGAGASWPSPRGRRAQSRQDGCRARLPGESCVIGHISHAALALRFSKPQGAADAATEVEAAGAKPVPISSAVRPSWFDAGVGCTRTWSLDDLFIPPDGKDLRSTASLPLPDACGMIAVTAIAVLPQCDRGGRFSMRRVLSGFLGVMAPAMATAAFAASGKTSLKLGGILDRSGLLRRHHRARRRDGRKNGV